MTEAAGEAQLMAHVLTQQALVFAAMDEVPRVLADLRRAVRDARSRGDENLVTVLNNRSDSGVLRTVLFNYADALERVGRIGDALTLAEELVVLDAGRPDSGIDSHQRMVVRLRKKLGA